ncbi:wd40 repeat-containing protein [Tubulinosema ratisbonensis]|uniref:Wd40 repeat-containing protein n=1 Tax=Tubulinosema ratisbonensis TaxID=291195 RepID=A0A437ALT4_9MICR|nr:wd40 repeat-containing protein [Tubulinosema ratisbonensis]
MRGILQDSTNSLKENGPKKLPITTREGLINDLSELAKSITDHNLIYDLKQCIDLLKGEDIPLINDYKESIAELAMENEKLFEEKADLIVENEYLKREIEKYKLNENK